MITAINRSFQGYPNIVHIATTDNLATITTTGYLTAQDAQIQLLNNGEFQWETDDIVLIFYATDLVNWFQMVASTESFAAISPPAGISATLPSADIIVGNGSNVATAVAMSGDVHIDNTGATTIQALAVTGAKMANNTVTFTQLSTLVEGSVTISLTAAQIKALYDTPVLVLAAGGANTVILVKKMVWHVTYVSAQYTAGGALQLQYDNTVHGAGTAASASIAAATLNAVAASSVLTVGSAAVVGADTTVLNKGVYISNATADFATGDSTAKLTMYYQVLTVS